MIAVRALGSSLLLRLLVRAGLGLRLPLQLLHLRPLILEPHLHHAHAEARVLRQGLPNLPAGLRRHLEGGLELSPLGGREDGPRPFRASATVAGTILVQQIIVCGAYPSSGFAGNCRVSSGEPGAHMTLIRALNLTLLHSRLSSVSWVLHLK